MDIEAQPQRQAEVRLRMYGLWRPDRFGLLFFLMLVTYMLFEAQVRGCLLSFALVDYLCLQLRSSGKCSAKLNGRLCTGRRCQWS
jgi:hypothetical protein